MSCFDTTILVSADTRTEAGAVAYLVLARKHPEHAREARMVECEPERFSEGRWNVRFRVPMTTGVGE